MVMVRSIIIPRISKRWSNPHNILDIKDSNTSRQNTKLAGEQVVFIMWTSSRWKEGKDVVDGNSNYQGMSMVLTIMNSIDILEGVKMLMIITTTFVERLHEEAIEQRWHQVKGMMKRKVIGTMGTTQTWNQVCCSRRNDTTRKTDVRLAHRRNLCSGKKN